MEDFGVRVDDDRKRQELGLRKLWNNFLIVADFYLWENFNQENGRQVIKDYIHDRLHDDEDNTL
jgi:hypothetical protein